MLLSIVSTIRELIASGGVFVYCIAAVMVCSLAIGFCGLFSPTSQRFIQAMYNIMMFTAGIALFSGLYFLFVM
jgi:hypothetical protein